MIKGLEIFREIVFGHRRPEKMQYSPARWQSLLQALQAKRFPFELEVQLRFFNPFSDKTLYYESLIEKELEKYFNLVCREMEADQDEDIKAMLIEELLTDIIPSFLRDLKMETDRKGISESDVNPADVNNRLAEEEHAETAFVLLLLKYQALRLYLSLKKKYGGYYEGRLLSMEQLHLLYFREQVPEPPLLVEPSYEEETGKPGMEVNSKDASFRYKYYDTDRLEELTYLRKELKRHKKIDAETTLAQFRNIFSGKPVQHPVRWTGNKSELYYLVYLLFNQTNVMQDLHNEHWKVACNCFVQPDGSPFEPKNLKDQKKPKSTFHLFEQMVSALK